MTTWTGAPIARLEDEHFLTGDTRFVDDISRPGLLHVAIVRSQVAAAALAEVETSEASKAPGVFAVLTAADLAHTNPLRPVLHRPQFVPTEMPLLATDRVRYVGEPLALVLARTRGAAEDAADLVWVEYDETPAVSSIDDALAEGAEPVHAEAPGNVLLDLPMFQDAALDGILAGAAVVVEGIFDSARVTAAPMEGRGRGCGMGSARRAAVVARLHPGSSHRAHRHRRHAGAGRAPGEGDRPRRRRGLRAEVRRGPRGAGGSCCGRCSPAGR